MSKVAEGLYIGSAENASDIKWLSRNGITHIVNCALELPDYFPKRFNYLSLNLDDTPSQNLNDAFEKSYRFIHSAITNGGRVLVHCYAGISRSASMVIYYLMRRYARNYYQAINYLMSKHNRANPNYGFVDQLMRANPMNYRTYNYNPVRQYQKQWYSNPTRATLKKIPVRMH